MPGPWDFLLLALSVFYAHAAYFRGSLFARWRAYFQAQRGTFLGELMTCPLCLAPWSSLLQVAALWLPGCFLDEPWAALSRLPLTVLALAGAAMMSWALWAGLPGGRDD